MKSLFLKSFSLCLLFVGAATLVSCGEGDEDILGPQIEPVVPHNVTLDATNFPDANFRAYVSRLTGVAEGEVIPAEVLASVTEIDVYDSLIRTLTGIEHFTALEKLDCAYNDITSLDVSKNVALKELDCTGNQLTSLDVSKNVALKKLECSSNDLTSLDVSKNVALETLYCAGNQLDLLDVSKNVALETLYCNNNYLTSLDVSKNLVLGTLHCHKNQLRGAQMDALIASLPVVSNGRFVVIYRYRSQVSDGNVCTVAQVNAARAKGWRVLDWNNEDYSGS